ncbi:unnamed protein product [Knipowitschia caucasica]|uniref:Uncharacterized protein n=1 Tax=Knipowitschia caucasica TaxID=637954 RepID=A0AAV2MNP5_KNICA
MQEETGEELLEREKRLLEKEAALTQKEDSVQEQNYLLPKEEDLLSEPDNSDAESSKEFYLSTVGLRSASSPEAERWTVEEESDRLKLEQDSLKVRLRCSFQTRDQSLQERGLETEQSLRGLRLRVDKLDSLLLRAKTHTSHK